MNRNALILSISPLFRDPRVLRQIKWLKDDYEITTVGTAPSELSVARHIDYLEHPSSAIKRVVRATKLIFKDYKGFYWRDERKELVDELKKSRYTKIIANDFDTLPLAFAVADDETKIIFDAHEYAPRHFDDQWQWRIYVQPIAEYVCEEYIPKVDSASTVCKSIADKYESEYGKEFQIITNAPAFVDQSPSKVSDPIRIIFHGAASESRRTHRQIEMMKYLDRRFELTFMLVGNSPYIARLKEMAKDMENVKFIPPVKTVDIATFTNKFDIGLFLLPPTNPNYRFILPNKFFEYIQARLAIAIGPSIEMKRIVDQYDLGVVAKDFSPRSLAKSLNRLSIEDVERYKQQAHQSAFELSADKNKGKFLSLVES